MLYVWGVCEVLTFHVNHVIMREKIYNIVKDLQRGNVNYTDAVDKLCDLHIVVESWVNVYDQEPPLNIEILAKDPKGVIHLTQWRERYGIFMCQSKSEGSFDWQWKQI